MSISFYGSLIKILQKYIRPKRSQGELTNTLLLAPMDYGTPEWSKDDYKDYDFDKTQASRFCTGKQPIPEKVLTLYSASNIYERLKECIINQIIGDIQKGRERQFLNEIFSFTRENSYLEQNEKNDLLILIQNGDCLNEYERIDFGQSEQAERFGDFLAKICVTVVNYNNSKLRKNSGKIKNLPALISYSFYKKNKFKGTEHSKESGAKNDNNGTIFTKKFNNKIFFSVSINIGAFAFFGCMFLTSCSALPSDLPSKISLEISNISIGNISIFQNESPQIEKITTDVGEGEAVYLSPGGLVDPGIEVIPQDADKNNIDCSIGNENLVRVTKDWEFVGLDGWQDKYENTTDITLRAGGVEPVKIHIKMLDKYNGSIKDIIQ